MNFKPKLLKIIVSFALGLILTFLFAYIKGGECFPSGICLGYYLSYLLIPLFILFALIIYVVYSLGDK